MNPISITYEVTRRYVSDNQHVLGPEVTNKILGWIRNRDVKALASCSDLGRLQFHYLPSFEFLRQIEAFFKKNVAFSSPEVCDEAALLSFRKAEKLCRITNRRLDYYFREHDRLDPDLSQWMRRAEGYVRSVLGDFGNFLGSLPGEIRITAGATASHSRRESLPFLKLRKRIACCPRTIPYLRATSKFFGYPEVRTVLGNVNRVEFVPKSWKTSRTIACEPAGNLPFQLAFDSYVKRRLRRRGIDLSDQTRNQRLAKEGSVTGKFATLDLSMASDTLAFNTVSWLLPYPWFKYLCDVRCPFGKGSFGVTRYAKFSSMGNGATFALETLIFASACYAVGAKEFSVYGDDIIIETELYGSLVRFLRFLGFSVNAEKSFHEGPFRESCGTDYLSGRLVTPFYLRETDDRKAVWCHNVNGLVKLGYPGSQMWSLVRKLIVDLRLPLVPANEATTSGVFIYPTHAYAMKLIKTRWSIAKFKALVPKSETFSIRDSRTLFLWHLDASRRRERGDPLIRSEVPAFGHKYVRKWVCWTVPAVGITEDLALASFSEEVIPG